METNWEDGLVQHGIRLYLATLRRLPEDVFLGIVGREIDPAEAEECIVGWAIRLGLAKAAGIDAEDDEKTLDLMSQQPGGYIDQIVALYGGTNQEWYAIYLGVVRTEAPLIEAAIRVRLNEIVSCVQA